MFYTAHGAYSGSGSSCRNLERVVLVSESTVYRWITLYQFIFMPVLADRILLPINMIKVVFQDRFYCVSLYCNFWWMSCVSQKVSRNLACRIETCFPAIQLITCTSRLLVLLAGRPVSCKPSSVTLFDGHTGCTSIRKWQLMAALRCRPSNLAIV